MREANITAVLARERRFDLQRAAGCCTRGLEHRRSLADALRRRRRCGANGSDAGCTG